MYDVPTPILYSYHGGDDEITLLNACYESRTSTISLSLSGGTALSPFGISAATTMVRRISSITANLHNFPESVEEPNIAYTTFPRATAHLHILGVYLSTLLRHQEDFHQDSCLLVRQRRRSFPAPCDSGSIVTDSKGCVVGFLIAGTCTPDKTDVAYLGPCWWIEEQIRKAFPKSFYETVGQVYLLDQSRCMVCGLYPSYARRG
ncbi:hypothetical protein DENSPDRAFT_855137 [Dentipellis sp. KUC8613]|nr:hypothetical protein DENSPDRAFT_855137 [Dentipellis sp. KUC8613]